MDCSMTKDVKDYLLYLKVERNLAPRTLIEYEVDLRLLRQFMQNHQVMEWSQVDYRDLRRFLQYLEEERGNSATARARKVSSVKGLFSFLHQEGHIPQDPAQRMKKPKLERRLPLYLSKEDCQRFIQVLQEHSPHQRRDVMIVLLFLSTGIRLAELTQLDVSHLDLSYQTLRVYGKGRKERIIPLLPQLIHSLTIYLQFRHDSLGQEAHTFSPLFFTNRKQGWYRITKRTVHDIFVRYSQLVRLDQQHFSAHKLRHTFATILYAEGVNLLELKDLLGHTSISTTEIYTHTSAEKLKSAVAKLPIFE